MARTPVLLIALSAAAISASQEFPGKEWKRKPHTLNPKVEKRVDNFVRALDTTGLMIVKGGNVVYEYGNTRELSYLASCRKSVLAMIYGKYVHSGTIKLNKSMADLGMDDVGGLLDIEKKATVEHLIQARSGVYHAASNQGDLLAFAPKRGSVEPGSYWLYSNWDFNAAGGAFERMTGRNIFDCLRDDLAIPIGMQDFQRNRQQKLGDLTRSKYPAYHMWLSVRDMARLGLLMRRNGRWNGKQVIPTAWVAKSTSLITPQSEMNPPERKEPQFGYGYMWWVWDPKVSHPAYKGAYSARGAFGQFITVIPSQDLVIAHKTIPVNRATNDSDYWNLLDRLVGLQPASELVLPRLKPNNDKEANTLFSKIKANPANRIVHESDLYAAGLTLTRHRKYSEAIRVLRLNRSLYPNSFRTQIALAEAQIASGSKAAGIATYRTILQKSPNHSKANLAMARLGESARGRQIKPIEDPKPYLGRYQGSSIKFVVARQGNHLRVREYDNFGELNDDYEVFRDDKGAFFVPFDGSTVTFGKNEIAHVFDANNRFTGKR